MCIPFKCFRLPVSIAIHTTMMVMPNKHLNPFCHMTE